MDAGVGVHIARPVGVAAGYVRAGFCHDELVQIADIRFRDRRFRRRSNLQHPIQGPRMVDCFQMVLEGLAADRDAFFQHQGGFAGGQRIALDCIGRVGDVDPLAVLQTVKLARPDRLSQSRRAAASWPKPSPPRVMAFALAFLSRSWRTWTTHRRSPAPSTGRGPCSRRRSCALRRRHRAPDTLHAAPAHVSRNSTRPCGRLPGRRY